MPHPLQIAFIPSGALSAPAPPGRIVRQADSWRQDTSASLISSGMQQASFRIFQFHTSTLDTAERSAHSPTSEGQPKFEELGADSALLLTVQVSLSGSGSN